MRRHSPSSAFVAASNASAWTLYRKLAPAGENFVFSPPCLRVCMGMAWLGARGETARQIAQVFGFPDERQEVLEDFRAFLEPFQGPDAEFSARMANSLWCDERVSPTRPFTKALVSSFFAQWGAGDFAGAPEAVSRDINAWARHHSHGCFDNIVSPEAIDPLTTLMLASLVHFRGRWESPFPEERTETAPFHLADGSTVPAPIMWQEISVGYFENERLQAVQMAYKYSDLRFLAFLPRDDGTPGAGLEGLERAMSRGLMKEVSRGLQQQGVELSLPRFTIDIGELDCTAAMRQLGLAVPFTPGVADFGEMTGQEAPGLGASTSGSSDDVPNFYLSSIVHRARIEADEAGTVADGATYLGLFAAAADGPPPKYPEFRADRPFLFMITQRRTGAVLFLGRLMNPAAG